MQLLISIITGCAAALIPNIICYKINFSYKDNKEKPSATTIIKKLYLGEIIKFLLMMVLFTAAIISGKLHLVTLFLAFIASQILWWLISSRVLLKS